MTYLIGMNAAAIGPGRQVNTKCQWDQENCGQYDLNRSTTTYALVGLAHLFTICLNPVAIAMQQVT